VPRRFRSIIFAPIALFLLLGPALNGASGAPAGTPSWLQAVNDYRALGGLPPVTEEASWSAGGVLHSKYMVKTGTIGHDEDPGSPWYTTEGDAAAENGNVAVSGTTAYTDVDAINDWISGPFHGIGILDPALERSGFGSFREAGAPWEAGATLDVIRGLDGSPATSPVMWPGNGAVHPLRSYDGNEFPDPLTSCSGLSAPTGPPVYLMLTTTPDVTAHSFSHNGAALGHCVFDGTDYQNPDQGQENLGRAVLGGRNAIVLMPNAPLSSGETYDVSITSNGQTYAWSFTTGGGSGGTEVNRTITLDLKVGSTIVGKGTVTDDAEAIACESSVPVKLQYKKPAGWRTIASDTTDADGKYRIATSIKVGRWRTKAAPTTVGDADCLKALSSVWRVTS
jgi:hypothetical protein